MNELNLTISEPDEYAAKIIAKNFQEVLNAANDPIIPAQYPKTVADITRFVHEGDDFWLALGDFLDCTKNKRGTAIAKAIRDEPTKYPELAVWQYAYLAAVADTISYEKNVYSSRRGLWFRKPEYCLDAPWFPPHTEGDLRLILWLESPAAFRKRGLFVSENVMSRV